MSVHKGEAWLDGDELGISKTPLREELSSQLALGVRFNEKTGARPEQILATAHAASFCVMLWSRLERLGHHPRRVHTVAYVHPLEREDRRCTEGELLIAAEAEVPGLSAERFASVTRAAKSDFVASRGLAGVPVKVEPKLLYN
jgi:osmotically inducible protein OsmC